MPVIRHYKDGKFAIYTAAKPTTGSLAVNSLKSASSKIHMHSDFEYLKIVYDKSVRINIDPLGSPTIKFPAHKLNKIPNAVLLLNGAQIPQGMPTQIKGNEGTYRFYSVILDTVNVTVKTHTIVNGSHNPGALNNAVFRIIMFDVAPPNKDVYPVHFDPNDQSFSCGYGKFHTDNRYLRTVKTGADYYMIGGASIDSKNGGYRFIIPGKPSITGQGYTGTFKGVNIWGVADYG